MQLEDYFEFEKLDTKFGPVETIRVKGTRIDIEHVVFAFMEGHSAERIQQSYPSLTLEQTYATITYYLQNKERVTAYIKQGDQIDKAQYQDWLAQGPSPVSKRLRELKANSKAEQPTT